jgi:hypothetical protein
MNANRSSMTDSISHRNAREKFSRYVILRGNGQEGRALMSTPPLLPISFENLASECIPLLERSSDVAHFADGIRPRRRQPVWAGLGPSDSITLGPWRLCRRRSSDFVHTGSWATVMIANYRSILLRPSHIESRKPNIG